MRLAGRAKAGFYPTPSPVVDRIITFIKPGTENIEGPWTEHLEGSSPEPGTAPCPERATESAARRLRILDPCCGLGDPLKRIAAHTGAESCGIELDRQRAAAAKEKLTRVIPTDEIGRAHV